MRWAALVLALATPWARSEEPGTYRCLAPFVWALEEKEAPANLFEVFLSGPFDRVEPGTVDLPPEPSAASWIDRGWAAWFEGERAVASRCFREAWHREEAAEALVALALVRRDRDPLSRVLAREAGDRLSPGLPWAELAGLVAEGKGLEEVERWVLLHPGEEAIASFVVTESLLAEERAIGSDLLVSRYLLEHPDWLYQGVRWARASGSEELLLEATRRVAESAGEGSVHLTAGVEALDALLSAGRLVEAFDLAATVLRSRPGAAGDPAFTEHAIDLLWRADQPRSAREWLRHYRRLPAPDRESSRVRDGISGEWEARLEGEEPVPGIVSGGISDRVREIRENHASGDLRAALFAIDRDLGRLVESSEHRSRWVGLLSPVLAEVDRSPSEWENLAPLTLRVPNADPVSPVAGVVLGTTEGEPVALATPGKGARLLLFYTGIGCPACQVELQAFRELSERFSELGVEIFAVSPQAPAEVARALAESGQEFPFAFCGDPELDVFRALGIYDGFELYPLHGAVLLGEGGAPLWSARSYAPIRDAAFVLEEAEKLLSTEGELD